MQPSPELDALARAVGKPATELSGLTSLTVAQLTALRQHLDDTQSRQRAGMESAIQSALGHLPALLRGPVIKILRG